MRRHVPAAVAAGLASALVLTACGSDDSLTRGPKVLKVGVILPDTSSSPRWESSDRPLLEQEFSSLGIQVDIQNAGGDGGVFQTIADGMIASDVNALLIASIDKTSGSAVIRNAKAAGIPVIDYDRLTVNGGAEYYVSFDNVAVGEAIGEGLVKCLENRGVTPADGGIIELNGSKTDNNATLFKRGYDKVLQEKGYDVLASTFVPNWDPVRGGALFETLKSRHSGDFVGVVAANDNLGDAVIQQLRTTSAGRQIPVTGQDASDAGLQRLLLGSQCVTVYKSTARLARTAAELTTKLIKGDKAGAAALGKDSVQDPETKAAVKAVLLEPQAIFREDVQSVIADGGTSAQQVCTTEKLLRYCKKYGVKL